MYVPPITDEAMTEPVSRYTQNVSANQRKLFVTLAMSVLATSRWKVFKPATSRWRPLTICRSSAARRCMVGDRTTGTHETHPRFRVGSVRLSPFDEGGELVHRHAPAQLVVGGRHAGRQVLVPTRDVGAVVRRRRAGR